MNLTKPHAFISCPTCSPAIIVSLPQQADHNRRNAGLAGVDKWQAERVSQIGLEADRRGDEHRGEFAAAVQRIRGRAESVGAIAALAKRLRGRVAGIADGGASAALRQLMTRRNPRRGGVAAQRLTGERWGCATGGAADVVGWLWAASTLIDDVRVRFIMSTGYRCVSAHRIAWFSHRHHVARAGWLIDHRA